MTPTVPVSRAPRFARWISTTRAKSDGPIGDLARDIRYDSSFPTKAQSLATVLHYLARRGAAPEALAAAVEAWDLYQSEVDL